MTDSQTNSQTPGAAAPARPRRRRRAAWIAAQITLGLGLGLVVTELAFATRDQHAFPHVNFYVADPELGARLQPGASMAFRLGDNPLSHISVNSQGFRGPEWPPPDADELLVVGDSQVFGLGVDDEQTFSAALGGQLGRTVLNGGVPTYGPLEYQLTAARLLDERPITTLVVVLNFLNDPFELDRPNRERHAIWDGWAVQIETAPAPEDITQFPGRTWLMSQSHTVYAARRWWHGRDQAWFERVDRGLPSEGNWDDLLVDSRATRAAIHQAELRALMQIRDVDRRQAALRNRLAEIERELRDVEFELDNTERRYNDDEIIAARPGGIISDRYSESARNVEVTAELYREALARRRARRSVQTRRDELDARRRELAAELAGTNPAPASAPEPELPLSVFEGYFVSLAKLCAAHEVELVLVMLPFDVQVSSSEWAKYDVEDGPDMSATLALLDDAMASAASLGIRAFNATDALREAEPGAFLDADIHMTPKGHAALAEALAAFLSERPAASEPASKSEPQSEPQSKSKLEPEPQSKQAPAPQQARKSGPQSRAKLDAGK